PGDDGNAIQRFDSDWLLRRIARVKCAASQFHREAARIGRQPERCRYRLQQTWRVRDHDRCRGDSDRLWREDGYSRPGSSRRTVESIFRIVKNTFLTNDGAYDVTDCDAAGWNLNRAAARRRGAGAHPG